MKSCKWMVGAFLLVGLLSAQEVKTHHYIGRVSEDGPSEPYLARTAYTLRWSVDPKYKLYGKTDPRVKAESYIAGVHVRDVGTGKIVHSLGQVPFTGETKVPVAGRHTVEFFSTAPWEASYVEDKATLEAAAQRGELIDGKTVTEASKESPAARRELVNELKRVTLIEIEKTRAKIGDSTAAELILAADKAAQLASDPDDFTRRFAALAAATFQNARAKTRVASSTTAPIKPTSSWSGQGLPPGMQRKPTAQSETKDLAALEKSLMQFQIDAGIIAELEELKAETADMNEEMKELESRNPQTEEEKAQYKKDVERLKLRLERQSAKAKRLEGQNTIREAMRKGVNVEGHPQGKIGGVSGMP